MNLLERLPPKARRGSKPRCHLLTHGDRATVAARLTSLATPRLVVSESDHWMPDGFRDLREAQLNKAYELLDRQVCEQLGAWWLPEGRSRATTPNFDIASTCRVDGVPGLLLVEAKAHADELHKEECGKLLGKDPSDDRRASHRTIADAITSAAQGLASDMSARCSISVDAHYQMSNRFAWAWKLTQLGMPVILVYLGFLNANEMRDRSAPFANEAEWESLVMAHSTPLFERSVWGSAFTCNGRTLLPLIRSVKVPLVGMGADPARILATSQGSHPIHGRQSNSSAFE